MPADQMEENSSFKSPGNQPTKPLSGIGPAIPPELAIRRKRTLDQADEVVTRSKSCEQKVDQGRKESVGQPAQATHIGPHIGPLKEFPACSRNDISDNRDSSLAQLVKDSQVLEIQRDGRNKDQDITSSSLDYNKVQDEHTIDSLRDYSQTKLPNDSNESNGGKDGDGSSSDDEYGPSIPKGNIDKEVEESEAIERLAKVAVVQESAEQRLIIDSEAGTRSTGIERHRDKWMLEPGDKNESSTNPVLLLKSRKFLSSKITQKTTYGASFDPSWTRAPNKRQ